MQRHRLLHEIKTGIICFVLIKILPVIYLTALVTWLSPKTQSKQINSHINPVFNLRPHSGASQ